MNGLLIVDGDRHSSYLMARYFLSQGMTAFTEHSMESALKRLPTLPCKVLLTELLLPSADGLQLIQQAKNQMPWLKIIAFTHGGIMNSQEILAFAYGLGADRVFKKPFNIMDIYESALELLHEQQQLEF